MAQKLRLWLPLLLWMGVIFAFSSMPINHQAKFSWTDFIIKKTAHVTEYAILYFLIYRAASNESKKNSAKIFLMSFIFSFIYSLSDEWHQTLTPGREGTIRDVGFDSLGMLLSLTWLKNRS